MLPSFNDVSSLSEKMLFLNQNKVCGFLSKIYAAIVHALSYVNRMAKDGQSGILTKFVS